MQNGDARKMFPATYLWALGKADYSLWRPGDSDWSIMGISRDLKDSVAVVSTLFLPEEYSGRRACCIGQGIPDKEYRNQLSFLETALTQDNVNLVKTVKYDSIIIARDIDEGKHLKRVIDAGASTQQRQVEMVLYGIPACDAWGIGQPPFSGIRSGILHDYKPHSMDKESTKNKVLGTLKGLQEVTPEFGELVVKNLEKRREKIFSPLEVRVFDSPVMPRHLGKCDTCD